MRPTYTKEDFKGMQFPIYGLGNDEDLFQHFPALSAIKAFEKKGSIPIDHQLLIRYVFYCYDKKSKLQTYPELDKRKKEAARLAGIHPTNVHLKALFDNQFKEVREMIIAFCRMQNNRLFQMRITALEAFYEYQSIILDPIDQKLDDDKMLRAANLKTKLIEDCDSIHEKINHYDEELYGSTAEAETLEETVGGISPENISKMMR